MNSKPKTIFLDAPSFGPEDKASVNKALDNGFASTYGPYVKEFETEMLDYLGAEATVGTQSGTAALHLVLHELGFGPGDEILVPNLTFIATANAVRYVNAKVVLVDVEPDTYNIDLEDAAKKVSKNTRGILPVHLLGNPCEIDMVEKFATNFGLKTVYDAAEALGSEYLGKMCGARDTISCFSFNGNKIITTGGGGMVSGPVALVERVGFLANQARDVEKGFIHTEVGFNYRMTNLEAALGLGQLSTLAARVEKKKTFRKIYEQELSELPGVSLQVERENGKSSYWLNAVCFDSEKTVIRIAELLKSKSIQTRRMFSPLNTLEPYRDNNKDFPISTDIYNRSLCLPSSVLNTEEDIRYVCSLVKEVLT